MESTVRARVPGQINFYTSTVENPRFDDESYRESLAETLRRGYSGVKLDLVMAANLQVLRFVMEYRDQMFPGVPVVFTDVGDQEDPSMYSGATGLISHIGMRETIDLALHLQSRYKYGRSHHRRIGVGQVLAGSRALRTSSSPE